MQLYFYEPKTFILKIQKCPPFTGHSVNENYPNNTRIYWISSYIASHPKPNPFWNGLLWIKLIKLSYLLLLRSHPSPPPQASVGARGKSERQTKRMGSTTYYMAKIKLALIWVCAVTRHYCLHNQIKAKDVLFRQK